MNAGIVYKSFGLVPSMERGQSSKNEKKKTETRAPKRVLIGQPLEFDAKMRKLLDFSTVECPALTIDPFNRFPKWFCKLHFIIFIA